MQLHGPSLLIGAAIGAWCMALAALAALALQ